MNLKTNVLYIHSHDTGRYVQPYGHSVTTPNIQKFVEQGILFRKAFSAAPSCSPSRAALLTGQYPHCCGMHGLANAPWKYELHDLKKLLPRRLAEDGWETVLAGIQHVTLSTRELIEEQGFGVFLNTDDLGEDVPDLHERVATYLNESKDLKRPWFMSVGFDQTHRNNHQGDDTTGDCFSKPHPYDPDSLDSRYCLPPAIYPDCKETRQDFASFKEGVLRLDERIGYVLQALANSGQEENTLVILTTDHGIAWPGMKCNLTDHGIGVMLAIRGPGGFHGGRVIDQMVTHMDIYPTLLEILDLPLPEWLQGKSLLPLINNGEGELHDVIFAEQGWHEVVEAQRAVRTARYKYVKRFNPVGPLVKNCDEGPTKNLLIQHGYFDRHLGEELLFDLYLDPQENCNRIDDPSLSSIVVELRHRLDQWMRDTNDPLLSGEAVPPNWDE